VSEGEILVQTQMRPASEVALGEALSDIEDGKCGWFDRDAADFLPRNRLFQAVTHEFYAAPEMLADDVRDERGA
jgi:hypothetical protein